jgi:hypothetical protein
VAVRARLVVISSAFSVVIDPAGWFEIPADDYYEVTASVMGVFAGHSVQIRIEYEQID